MSRPAVHIHAPRYEVYCERCGTLDMFRYKRDATALKVKHEARHCIVCGWIDCATKHKAKVMEGGNG